MRLLATILGSVLAAAACASCAGRVRLADDVYPVGIGRSEVLERVGSDPRAALDRPAGGWATAAEADRDVPALAVAFEAEEGVVVDRCEVYWVPRGFLGMGVYFDYLFFGPDGRLVGSRRRFVD